MRWSQAWGFKSHRDLPVLAQAGPERATSRWFGRGGLFYRPGPFAGIFVRPDPDCGPARRSESSVGVAVATGDARNFRRHQLAFGVGQMAVIWTAVPEAAIDDRRDTHA